MSDEQNTCPNCGAPLGVRGAAMYACVREDLCDYAASLRNNPSVEAFRQVVAERDEARELAESRKRNIKTRKKRAARKSQHRKRLAAALAHYKRRFREVRDERDEAREEVRYLTGIISEMQTKLDKAKQQRNEYRRQLYDALEGQRRADEAWEQATTEPPSECERCMGRGSRPIWGTFQRRECPDCGGTGKKEQA